MRAFLLASVVFMPGLAMAEPGPVPAIQTAAIASASASVTAAAPQGLPPAIKPLSPSAPLNAKEKASASMARQWRNRNDRPTRGEDGVLRWTFGASLPSVVCAPLQVCDVALQPGEVVNDIRVGDLVRWKIDPAVTGSGTERTTHLIIKPTDAGLVSSVLVFTDRRTYSIKLISTQREWTPLTAFNYPETTQAAWADYSVTMASASSASSGSIGGPTGNLEDLDFNYKISGDAPWRPLRVYSTGGKTIIEFPDTIQYGTAPVLIGLANDGSWFSSPSEQMLRYRIFGNRFVVDGLFEHAKLVTGVGGSQTKVDIRKGDR